MAADPITVEVLRNALPAIADEMSHVLKRTSYNMMIYEVGDYSCAILDKAGNLLAQNGGGVSHFLADLGVVIRDGVQRIKRFAPGDVILMNHHKARNLAAEFAAGVSVKAEATNWPPWSSEPPTNIFFH